MFSFLVLFEHFSSFYWIGFLLNQIEFPKDLRDASARFPVLAKYYFFVFSETSVIPSLTQNYKRKSQFVLGLKNKFKQQKNDFKF